MGEPLATPPKRIQRKRTRGWKMPEGAVSVTRPGPWGNPFIVGDIGVETAAEAVKLYREWWRRLPDVQVGQRLWVLNQRLSELRGHDLACWCPLTKADGSPHPCHADILLSLANIELPEIANA